MNNLTLKCNKCEAHNTIPIDRNIVCYNCKTKIFKNKNQFLKSLKNILFITGISFATLQSYKLIYNKPDRYELKEEYAILNGCIESNNYISNISSHLDRLEICSCTLKNIQDNNISLLKLNNNPNIFLNSFNRCKLKVQANAIRKNPMNLIKSF